MKHLLLAISLLFTMLFACTAQGQDSRVAEADSLFANQSFYRASELYHKVLSKGKCDSAKVIRQLAYCYEELDKPLEAESWFQQSVSLNPNAEDMFHYALALKSNQKYAMADFVMEEFQSKETNDRRAYSHLMNRNTLEDIEQANNDTKLSDPGINTKRSEFGAVYGPEGVVFLSARETGMPTTRIYERTQEPFLDLFVAQAQEDGTLKAIKPLKGDVNSPYHEGNCTFSADSTVMYFTRNAPKDKKKGGLVHLQIFRAEWDGSKWTNVTPFEWNDEEYSVGHPTLSSDGRRIYFVSNRKGGLGGTDIYVCFNQKDGDWSRPQNLGTLVNTEGDEMFPYCHPDDVLYFSSNGHYGLGGMDLFVSPIRDGRPSKASNLGAPYNSPLDDLTVIFDSNRHTGYLSSNRSGNDDISYFEVAYDKPSAVKGLVVDANGKPFPNVTAQLYDSEGKLVEEKDVDPNGEFLFFLDKMKCRYFVRVINEDGWTIFESAPTPCTYEADPINLGKVSVSKQFWKANGTVRDQSTKSPIEGFVATLVNMQNGAIEVQETNDYGEVNFNLIPDTDYTIVFEKEGYFAKSGEFTTKGMEPGIVSIERFVQLFFEPLEVNTTIEIENIYYAYDGYEISPAAAKSLENVVNTMLQNPNMVVELASHTDSRGTQAYNMQLSKNRVEAILNYLISRGVPKEKMKSKAYGESRLINGCDDDTECSEEQHRANRRTEFKVIKIK